MIVLTLIATNININGKNGNKAATVKEAKEAIESVPSDFALTSCSIFFASNSLANSIYR